jgi:UDP-glucose-4-epimerase GalE
MKFFVIGGAGYVGSHFVLEAKRQGFELVVYDNLSTGHKESVPSDVKFIEGDILDETYLTTSIENEKPDVVFHYAALALVGESVEKPGIYYRNNVEGTRCMLDSIVNSGLNCPVVFSSTCAIFGSPKSLPIDENAPKSPESPYGFTKYACEKLLEDYVTAYGLKISPIRYFNACGADKSGSIGELHSPETHLIPNLLRRILDEEQLTVFGNDYPTRDGTNVRDYIHVTDLAISHIEAAKMLVECDKPVFEPFNLGTGDGYTTMEIINSCEKVLGKKSNFVIGERRAGDAVALYANNQKVKEVLNFTPEHSSLENILETAWAWHSSGEKFFS